MCIANSYFESKREKPRERKNAATKVKEEEIDGEERELGIFCCEEFFDRLKNFDAYKGFSGELRESQ